MGLIYYHATTIFITTKIITDNKKQKYTHRCREQMYGHQGGEKEDGMNWQIGNDYILLWASQVVIVVKNPPVNARAVSKRPGFDS